MQAKRRSRTVRGSRYKPCVRSQGAPLRISMKKLWQSGARRSGSSRSKYPPKCEQTAVLCRSYPYLRLKNLSVRTERFEVVGAQVFAYGARIRLVYLCVTRELGARGASSRTSLRYILNCPSLISTSNGMIFTSTLPSSDSVGIEDEKRYRFC